MRTIKFLTFVVSIILLLNGNVQAEFLSVRGNGVDGGSAAGLDLRPSQTESPLVQGFREKEDVVVSDSLTTVDHLISDNLQIGDEFQGLVNFQSANGRQLPPGTYDSHLLHFDPPGPGGIVEDASTTFDQCIVAIIKSNSGDATLLNNTDSLFGNAGNYDNSPQRRADAGAGLDIFRLESNNTIQIVKMQTGSGLIDNVRVITANIDPDNDGILCEEDFICPDTPLGEPVNPDGCTAGQVLMTFEVTLEKQVTTDTEIIDELDNAGVPPSTTDELATEMADSNTSLSDHGQDMSNYIARSTERLECPPDPIEDCVTKGDFREASLGDAVDDLQIKRERDADITRVINDVIPTLDDSSKQEVQELQLRQAETNKTINALPLRSSKTENEKLRGEVNEALATGKFTETEKTDLIKQLDAADQTTREAELLDKQVGENNVTVKNELKKSNPDRKMVGDTLLDSDRKNKKIATKQRKSGEIRTDTRKRTKKGLRRK